MPYFRGPKVLFGKGAVKQLGFEIKGLGAKAMIITGQTMGRRSGPVIQMLEELGYEVKVWDQSEPEPSVQGALAAGRALAEFAPELIVGFGGGSALDTAKAAWLLYANQDQMNEDFWKAFNPKSSLRLQDKARFLAVPTTSGSGSEVTWALILTDKSKNRKIAVANNALVPDWALLVPEYTAGMPPELTAGSGLDVLGHAFDAYTARQQNDFSDGLCLKAISMCFEWLPAAYKNGDDLLAREKMQNAACMAGLGFGNSNTSLSHSLGHALGTTFSMPHGRAVGISLAPSLEHMVNTPPAEGADDPVPRLALAARVLGITGGDEKAQIVELVGRIRQLRTDLGEPLGLKELGVGERAMQDKLDSLVLLASKDVNIYSSPCPVEPEAMSDIFWNIWKG